MLRTAEISPTSEHCGVGDEYRQATGSQGQPTGRSRHTPRKNRRTTGEPAETHRGSVGGKRRRAEDAQRGNLRPNVPSVIDGMCLRSQRLAALAATCGNDGTTSAGTHASTEAVNASATAVIRLESPLAFSHGTSLLTNSRHQQSPYRSHAAGCCWHLQQLFCTGDGPSKAGRNRLTGASEVDSHHIARAHG